MRYRNDILLNNTFGGHCDLDKVGLDAAMTSPQINKRPLASWMREMEHFTSLPTQPLATGECDVIIERPTIIIKMDEEYNIFHHTCVFMNLYISLHVNNSFSNDVNILVWDTSLFELRGYMTEIRDAFTRHDVMLLKHLDGKRVCFQDAIFSLPARMMLGIYYNLAPVKGCKTSGLVNAFSEHVLHNLNIQQTGPLVDKLRVTFLVRSTKIRRILNQEEMLAGLQRLSDLEVQMVDFNKSIPFIDQLQIIHNTDLFIGLHGAGLTYMLYLPDWATVFEIYRCGIDDMYPDLARMRGINYITWENIETLIPENKTVLPNYTNYSFDVEEFVRLVRVAADQVTSHPDLIKARHHKYREKGEL
ncbi:EGF domain-specific O-linked N-acetylglucosamine transferase-like [Haliotis rufescens]|uniref:EGF domain-specific O-linked N-acetylglucosamine transferase-like n=1 Tax=Haliotis rufescens TaxID=6454 RepID=UPI00201EE91F|nr:EGF domain-specific O-linked N-acetylglucosamine transferase-like [Haliotis rufescens]